MRALAPDLTSALALSFFALLLGLSFGSFATVLVHRVPVRESLWTRSKCPHCDRRIKSSENIPLFSYLRLRGACPGCGVKISWIYPALEGAMALLFLVPVLFFHSWSALALWVVLAIFGLPLIVTDLKLHRLPNSLTLALFLTSLLTVCVSAVGQRDFHHLATSISGGVGLGAFYLLIALISKGGMGMGDVKLSVSVGLISGYFGLRIVLVSSFTAFALGSVIGLLLIIFGKAGRKSAIPFGPFMILGQFVGLLVAAH